MIAFKFSPGGHAVVGLTMARWLAESFPHARRVGFTVAPEGDEQRKQFVELLHAYDNLYVDGRPALDTIVITCNRLNPQRQDEVSAHLDACAVSAVTSGGQRGDNIANIFALARTESATDRVHYLSYRWARKSVPIHHPPKQSGISRLLNRKSQEPASTTLTVLTQEAFSVAEQLASGRGTRALLGPFSEKSGTAMFLGIPSNSWEHVALVKQTVEEQLVANGLVDHNRRGPITGRYDLPQTATAPLIGILLGEIEGGLPGIETALRAAPQTYIHQDSYAIESA